MNLFWRKGYHATSLKDLETELAMRPGSIYAAFQSKEALFRATLDRYSERMGAELADLIDQSPSPLAALQQHLLNLAELAPSERPSTACMLVKSLLEVPEEGALRSFITGHLDRIEDAITKALQKARQMGELPAECDTERLARRVQTYIFGLKVQAQRQTDPAPMRALCADLAEELGRISRPAQAQSM
ncbi:TetR/AcrR family transcriptional regulator [Lutimaribacter marinistellae]|uniref:TetR/AcrR family transcriptional regulator n=1 Tax=Lutimaribacter marinistellae TaxID=1820329 RepID=A0ABV7TMI2_9RHOB